MTFQPKKTSSQPLDCGQEVKRILIITGEASADLHAAGMVQDLLAKHKNKLQIRAVGGSSLASIQEVTMINMLAQHGVMGFVAVLTHVFILRKAYTDIVYDLKTHKPDLLILVDFPGFNLKIAKYAKSKLGIKVLYYISPQIWAWKENRINDIKKYVDHMAVILPFEKELYTKANIPCSFVGHPILNHLLNIDTKTARANLNLPISKKIIALLPGSRKSEIKKHMPILLQTIRSLKNKIPNLIFILPLAPTVSKEFLTSYIKEPIPELFMYSIKAQQAIHASDFVIVASGTASLESALLLKPMCIIYKTSIITSMIVGYVIKIKYAGLCNLIANKMIVPELLQDDCTVETLSELVLNFFTNPYYGKAMIKRLQNLKQKLTLSAADTSLDKIVEKLLLL